MTKQNGNQAASAKDWSAAAVHYPLLPSGTRVAIRIPDLAALIESGKVPNHLLDAALGGAQAATQDKAPTVEDMTKSATEEREFTDLLVKATVVEPELTDEDLGPTGIPTEDKQLLVAFATRQRDLDAEGEHIAGLTKSEKFRRFRELGEFSPTLEGA